MEYFFEFLAAVIVLIIIYDKYIQRKHQLLINYPLIGRFRYLFEMLREPFRQYFGDEDFYESKDKVDWVYSSARDKVTYASFSPTQPQPNPKFLINHANSPLNDDEVDENFSVTFGEKREFPFVTKSVVGRSAMSDGAISPEGTRAFTKGAYDGKFPINTGEGSLTSNFFFTHHEHDDKYMERFVIKGFHRMMFKFTRFFINNYIAITMARKILLDKDEEDTYIFDSDSLVFYRPNWRAPLENFPKQVPSDMPDIIFQMSSGLYGVRDKEGHFDEERYLKTMSFCRMTEIKLAQGAKQTGGKLMAEKVTPSIAYYRGVEPYKSLYSPNRFPYATSITELFDFVARLQKLSKKPVGIKLVISNKDNFEEYVKEIRRRVDEKLDGIPDFINIDGGDGGSATAPLYLMDRVGFHVKDALFLADKLLKEYGVRGELKLIGASKILTPDDLAITLALGADFVMIGRGFMMSAGCIRARMCSGAGSHNCPVGLATQKKSLRRTYLVYKHAAKVTNYHKNLLHGLRTVLAVMGKRNTSELESTNLSFIDRNGFIHEDIDRYYSKKIN